MYSCYSDDAKYVPSFGSVLFLPGQLFSEHWPELNALLMFLVLVLRAVVYFLPSVLSPLAHGRTSSVAPHPVACNSEICGL